MPGNDLAVPDDLRRAARDTGARAHALDGGLRSVQAASSGFTAAGGALIGPSGTRFRSTLDGLRASFVAARAAHEEVAHALHNVADPIEREQETRRLLEHARRWLAEARRRLTAEQLGVAAQERRAAACRAMGDPVPHIDRSGLVHAQHEVEEAERAVQRAAHRHDEAERERERAVRMFVAVCRAATAPGPLPVAPGAPGAAQVSGWLRPSAFSYQMPPNPPSL